MNFAERSKVARNTVVKNLFELMDKKKSNLCLSIDLTKKDEILKIVSQIGDYLCLGKTHADIIEDFDHDFVKQLRKKNHFYSSKEFKTKMLRSMPM